MSACWCSLAGTAACRLCLNNPFAETPPTVRTYTVSATDPVLITWQKTNADRIRAMSDEELAELLNDINSCTCSFAMGKSPCDAKDCPCWLSWLKAPVEEVEA